jgi:3-methyladenine DNA glycosylase/8-oxoguanine DNA glycosylase
MELNARQPFSLPAVARSHGWMRLAPFTWDDTTGLLTYVDRLSSGRVTALRMVDTPGGVQVSADGDLTPGEASQVAEHVSWMLGLERDFSDFYSAARDEPKLAKAVARGAGRVLRCPTVFEDVVKTILTTNTLWGGTIRMAANLVELYGEASPDDPEPGGSPSRAFPTPEQLAALDAERLRQEARLGYRAPYILELAQRVASGQLDLEALKDPQLPTAEARQRLLGIKGVGNYAAANLLMILGHTDDIPVDSWALKMVSQEFYSGEPVGRAEVEAAFERWGRWKGMAYWFWDWEE